MKKRSPHQLHSTRKSSNSCPKWTIQRRISAIDSRTCSLIKEMRATILGSSNEKRALKLKPLLLLKLNRKQSKLMDQYFFRKIKGLLLLRIWRVKGGLSRVEGIIRFPKWLGSSTLTSIKRSNLKENTTTLRFNSTRISSLNSMKNKRGLLLPINPQSYP